MCPFSWEERKHVSSASLAFQSSSFCCLPCTNPGTVSAKGPHALLQAVDSCSPFPHSLSGLSFIPFAFCCLENNYLALSHSWEETVVSLFLRVFPAQKV